MESITLSNIPFWVDDFIFWDAILVASFIFIDFLLGKEGRQKLREKVGWWWLIVSENSYRALLEKDARTILDIFHRFFGDQTFSLRFLKRTALATLYLYVPLCIITIVLIIIESPLLNISAGYNLFIESTTVMEKLVWSGMPIILLLVYLNGVLANLFSVAITIWLLRIMTKSVYFLIIVGLMLLDVLLGWLSLIITMFPSAFLVDWLDRGLDLFHKDAFDMTISLYIAMFFITIIPSLFHILLGGAFLLSKLIRPILQKPTTVLLQRLYESEKGILTVVAIGIGAISKLAQEALKYLSG